MIPMLQAAGLAVLSVAGVVWGYKAVKLIMRERRDARDAKKLAEEVAAARRGTERAKARLAVRGGQLLLAAQAELKVLKERERVVQEAEFKHAVTQAGIQYLADMPEYGTVKSCVKCGGRRISMSHGRVETVLEALNGDVVETVPFKPECIYAICKRCGYATPTKCVNTPKDERAVNGWMRVAVASGGEDHALYLNGKKCY